jgi:hypothetical protein
MKTVFSAITFLFILILSSCATPDTGKKYEFIEPNSLLNVDEGYLKVFTCKIKEKGGAWDDPVYDVYKGYTIYTREGEYIMDINRSYEKPELVKLEAGEYIIIAELHKNIINSFSVKIQRGKILAIDKSMVENPYASKD